MNPFDQAARFAVKIEPPGFWRWLLSEMDPDLTFTRWLDTQTIPLPGAPDRRCDTVAEMVHASGLWPPWALVLELQTRPDPDMPERLLEYMARLRRELRHGPHGRDKYLVGAAVINLTGPAQADTLDMVLPGQAGVEFHWQMRVPTMADEDAAATLAGIDAGSVARGLLPWVPLMSGGGASAVIGEWKRLAGLEPESRRRADYASVAKVFAELAHCLPAWAQGLEGWNVEESQVVKEWQAQALRGALLRALQKKFPAAVPTDVLAVIESQHDLDQLSRWMDTAMTATSLDDFRAALRPE